MRRPRGRKVAVFIVLSIAYWACAAPIVVLAAIRVCSMQPDVAAECDPTPVLWVAAAAFLLYATGTIAYFRARLSGVD